jgi:hypothetical protein
MSSDRVLAQVQLAADQACIYFPSMNKPGSARSTMAVQLRTTRSHIRQKRTSFLHMQAAVWKALFFRGPGQGKRDGSMGLLTITLALFAAPIVAIILNATGTVALNRPDRQHQVVLGQ